MRRLIGALLAAACAQPGMPPGGPPDNEPPAIVRVLPDSNALNVRRGSVTLEFDEVVSERPAGATELADLFLVSPSDGRVRLSWRRTRLEISPAGGLRPNTTYTVQMLPGLSDLSNNVDSTGMTLVFSTGPDIAMGRIAGRVFDWAAARVAPRAYVEAISLPDSGRYATTADSAGRFEIRHLRPGRYTVQALVDQNRNREIDGRELFDSVTVELQDSLRREMLAALRDSLGPGIATITPRDSMRIRVTLDRPLDTAFVVSPAPFSLKAADSTESVIRQVLTQQDLERVAADSARQRALQDSVRQAAVEDSIRLADSTRAAARGQPPPRPTGRRPGAQVAPPPARVDTTPPPARPSAKIPITEVYLDLEQPLRPGTTYRLRAVGLRSITGAARESERVFTTPRARPPTDTGSVSPRGGSLDD